MRLAARSATGKVTPRADGLKRFEKLVQAGSSSTVRDYNKVLSACSSSAEWRLALRILDHLCRQGPAPTLVTLNSTVHCCGQATRWEHALALFQEWAGDSSLKGQTESSPSTVSTDAHHQQNHKQPSKQHHQQLLAATSATDTTAEPAAPSKIELYDDFTFSALALAFERGSQWSLSLHLLDSVLAHPTHRPSKAFLSSSVSSLQKAQQARLALQLHEEQVLSAPDITPNRQTYGAALAACETGSYWESALQLINRMQGEKLQPDAIMLLSALQSLRSSSSATPSAALAAASRKAHAWIEEWQLLQNRQSKQVSTSECLSLANWLTNRFFLAPNWIVEKEILRPLLEALQGYVSEASLGASLDGKVPLAPDLGSTLTRIVLFELFQLPLGRVGGQHHKPSHLDKKRAALGASLERALATRSGGGATTLTPHTAAAKNLLAIVEADIFREDGTRLVAMKPTAAASTLASALEAESSLGSASK